MGFEELIYQKREVFAVVGLSFSGNGVCAWKGITT
jgi:hypothetical protein